jgi:hypothetical protein
MRPVLADPNNAFSSYRESLLEHLFAGNVMKHLWTKDYSRIEVLKPQVDDSGYDLVLETDSVVRHVQLKTSLFGAATQSVNVHIALAYKPSGCVVWIRFDKDTLDFKQFLWFGGDPGEKLPDIENEKIATSTRPNSSGIKVPRHNLRVLPKAKFEPLSDIASVVTRLFGSADNVKTHAGLG